MCLILFGYRSVPGHALVVAANRDEVHARATDPAAYWQGQPGVLAGRDRVAGGTWLGVTRTGRFAALTNFSRPEDPENPESRGGLVSDFLTGTESAAGYADRIEGHRYAGFNLLLFDGTELRYLSNRGANESLKPGFYGLANAELGAEWPKCVRGATGLRDLTQGEYDASDLLDLLADRTVPPDSELPDRGRDLELERRIAPCFITDSQYGTRASTIVQLTDTHIDFTEQTYHAGGKVGGRVNYSFAIERAGHC